MGGWLMVFMVFASLLLLNMLLAIVMDAYSEIKLECMDSEPLWHQVKMSLKNLEGVHVPLGVIVKSLEADIPEGLGDDVELDEEQKKQRAEFDTSCLFVEDLITSVAKPFKVQDGIIKKLLCGRSKPKIWAMEESQATEIIMKSITNYY